MVSIGTHHNIEIEEDLLRHMVLNSLRSYKAKFGNEYGEMIIACDGKQSWRKKVYPYYKANRKKNRKQSEIDWTSLFNTLDLLRDELRDNFPYRVIMVNECEADDVIGTLVNTFKSQEQILIVSGDKDFRQLQDTPNVKQYDPVRKKWITEKNAQLYLKEHIMRGDPGDGVPNFLSDDDCFVISKKRQKPLSSKKVNMWIGLPHKVFCNENEQMLRGWMRNDQMVNLEHTPVELQEEILKQYHEQGGKDRSKLFNYFLKHKLKNLLTDIEQF